MSHRSLAGHLALCSVLLASHLGAQPDRPPGTVTVRVRRSAEAFPGAVIRMVLDGTSYEAIANDKGEATLTIPRDPSLGSLEITYPGMPDWKTQTVRWQRIGRGHTATIVIRDEPPFPLDLTLVSCSSSPMHQVCTAADGIVDIYELRPRTRVISIPVVNGRAHTELPFHPAGADLAEDLVGAESRAGGERHRAPSTRKRCEKVLEKT
jgi:hypothetical protein